MALTPTSPQPPLSPSFSPLYRQIVDLLTRSLQSGEWKPGEAIPSELELAARFKVSQGTVRKAIDDLAGANLLVRRQGKGTFVATHAEEKTQFRFLRLAPNANPHKGAADRERLSRRFLDCKRQRASAEVAKALGLKSGEPVLHVRRVLSFRGEPVVLDDLWLPTPLFKGLTATKLSSYEGPLYGLFEAEYGVRMIRAEEQIRAVAAEVDEAALLNVAVGAPLLSVWRVTYTYDDQPVEVRLGRYDTTHHHYRNALS
jgi:GntR family transcriptional regulator